MRAKQQPTTQLTQSSLALTILPSAANDRGRKSREVNPGADIAAPAGPPAPAAPPAPVPVPEPEPAPMEFAGAPSAPTAAAPAATTPDWAAPTAPPAPAVPTASPARSPSAWEPPPAPAWGPPTSPPPPPSPSWGVPSDSRFGSAPPPQFGAPPLNYPAAPGFPPQPLYAESAAVDYLPPAAPGAWVPHHSSAQHGATGAPPAYGPPVFGAPGYSGYSGYPPAGPPQRSALSKILIGVAIVLAVMVGLAVAIPVFLSQRPAANRNVVLPATLVEQQQLHDADLDASTTSVTAELQHDWVGLTQIQSAWYGEGAQVPLFMVVAGKFPHKPTAAQTKAYFDAANTSDSSEHVALGPTAGGPFGGTMECGTDTTNDGTATVCASVDDAAVIVVVSPQLPTSQLATFTRQIIGSVEQKG